jgi:hypothetical protein
VPFWDLSVLQIVGASLSFLLEAAKFGQQMIGFKGNIRLACKQPQLCNKSSFQKIALTLVGC